MSDKPEIIVEGTYNYLDHEHNYAQENFKMLQFFEKQTYQFRSEVLARNDMGEFLKVLVNLDLNSQFFPTSMRVEKSQGRKYSLETFSTEHMEFKYKFQNKEKEQDHQKVWNARNYLTSPASCTSTLFSLTKKWDPTGRTPVTLVSSANQWDYEGPPQEKNVFVEYKTSDVSKVSIQGTDYVASHLAVYENDSSSMSIEEPVNFFINKQYGFPYRIESGTRKIELANLKIHFQTLK